MRGPAGGCAAGASLEVRDLGRMAYRPALEVQERAVEQRRRGTAPDTLLLVEHDPVYTLGRGGKEANVLLAAGELARRGVEVIRAGRGGDVTYHGPGQLVGYPIVDLAARGMGVLSYVQALEDVIARSLADFGVRAERDPLNRGVWVGREKIAAIGVRVTRGITMHGFALNVSTDLSNFACIVPCGIRDRGVTSLVRLVPGATMDLAKSAVVRRFREAFGGEDGER